MEDGTESSPLDGVISSEKHERTLIFEDEPSYDSGKRIASGARLSAFTGVLICSSLAICPTK
jgi:hypothetical protein